MSGGRLTAQRMFNIAVLLIAAAASFFPIYWAISVALKHEADIVSYPPSFLPIPPTLEHVGSVVAWPVFLRSMFNSVVISSLGVLLSVAVGAHAAYAVSRYRFRARNVVMFGLLATFMIPGIVTLIPQYLFAVKLGLHDTYLVLILVYGAAQAPLCVWIMRSFIDSVPVELDESATVDGCGPWRIFYRIIVPLAWPGLSAAALLAFIWIWSEFIIGLSLTGSPETRPVTVGVYFFLGEIGIDWGRLAAAAVIAVLPPVALFLFLQRRFIEGLTAGSLKG